MTRHSTYAAGQARLAWRLFLISAIINIALATGLVICGCYSVIFSQETYIAADNRLHFTHLERLVNVDESSLELVDTLYKRKMDGTVSEERDGKEASKEDSAAETKE